MMDILIVFVANSFPSAVKTMTQHKSVHMPLRDSCFVASPATSPFTVELFTSDTKLADFTDLMIKEHMSMRNK
jgi:hypothetical protein